MKKLLFINGHLNAGGVEKSLLDILLHMDYSKYQVDLLLLENLGDYTPLLPPQVHVIFRDLHNTYGGVVSSLVKCLRAHDFRCFRLRLIFLLQKFVVEKALRPAAKILLGRHHYDAVIGFRTGICSDLAAYSVCADRKLTWWHHGAFNVAPDDYEKMCTRMDYVVSVSNACSQMILDACPSVKDKLLCIPNMLDTAAIDAKADHNPYAASHKKIIVSVGRLAPEKHFIHAIEVAKYLLAHGISDFSWHIVGEGPECAALEVAIAENNLEAYVRLEGNQPNPYPYMRHGYLFVHPSYVESQGLTILEAMALDVPCVVTKSLGPCEFIRDGENGLLVEQGWEPLAEGVLRMLTDKALYEKIKDNTHCPEQFAPETVMQKIYSILEG